MAWKRWIRRVAVTAYWLLAGRSMESSSMEDELQACGTGRCWARRSGAAGRWSAGSGVARAIRKSPRPSGGKPGVGTVKLSGILGFWRRNRSSVERRINNLGTYQGAD